MTEYDDDSFFRFQRLVEKLLSVKFVIFIVATVLLCCGVLGGAEWLTVALTVIAGREIQKFKDFKFTRKVTSEESLGSDSEGLGMAWHNNCGCDGHMFL